MIAPMSSAMASASRNSLSQDGAREPIIATTPVTIAMSVAIGIPQPRDASVPALRTVKISAGTTIPPARGDDRQRGLARVAKLALCDLALDLETGDEEEQHHRHVVDPSAEIEHELVVADADHGVGVPQVEVRVGPWRVRPRQGDEGSAHEQDAGPGFGAKEVGERPDEAVSRGVGRPASNGSEVVEDVIVGLLREREAPGSLLTRERPYPARARCCMDTEQRRDLVSRRCLPRPCGCGSGVRPR